MVGEIEPGTGIEALDNLILALRKIGLLVGPNEPVMRYDSEELWGFLDQALVTSWPEANSDRFLAPQGADIVLPDPPPPPLPPRFTTPPDPVTPPPPEEQDDSDIWNTEDEFIMIAPAATDDYIVVPANGKTQLFLCPAFYRRVTAITIDFIAATPANSELGQYLGHRDNFTFLPDRPGPVPIPAGTVAVSIRYNASHRFTVWCA
jgi:phage tail protein X